MSQAEVPAGAPSAHRGVPVADVLAAAVASTTGSFVLVCTVVGFVGASMCWQAAWQARRILGDQSFIGPEFLLIMTREFTPLMLGMMLAARGGAGLAAALATRRSTMQADAVLLQGDNPVRLFAWPQVLGAWLAALLLAPPALVAGEFAGVLLMKTAFNVEPASFVATGVLATSDLVFSLLKAAVFGLTVTLLGARAGLRAHPSAWGVGQAATRGVVDGAVGVLVLDAVLDALRFVTGWP